VTSGEDKANDQPPTVAAGNDETTIVPPPTEAAPTLAYSETDDEAPRSWRDAIGSAALPLFVTAAAAVAALVGFWVWLEWPSTPAPTAANNWEPQTAAQPPTVLQTVVLPPSTAVTAVPTSTVAAPAQADAPATLPDPPLNQADRAFLARIHRDKLPTDDDGDAVLMGHQQCSEMRQDGTSTYQRATELQGSLNWTFPQAFDFVTDAATVYCPQLG
jgi:hypothetical protein